ncbi:sialoadhesin-like [Chrysoperla carnea]|uniref:sialoadhesin-like n=1 Tax=Chrysoperla carnea TaxID=189513 RepID=UPI001D0610D2|nr:sialoadhesin-like [Chrysoperla carnea]
MSTYLTIFLLWLPSALFATSSLEIQKRSASLWPYGEGIPPPLPPPGSSQSSLNHMDHPDESVADLIDHFGIEHIDLNELKNLLNNHPNEKEVQHVVAPASAAQTNHVNIGSPTAGLVYNSGNNTVTNVTVQLGTTAYLHCHVRHSDHAITGSEQQISWIRRRDWHILSSGMFVYTNDERFQVLHAEGSDDWTLQIKYVQKRDNGTYECQLATGTGIVSLFVNLQIVVPEAFILGSSERHVDAGSVIRLVCVVEKSPTPPQYVFWYHNERMINYDMSRGGIHVETEPGPQTQSRLTIRDARDSDSGNYTCTASNTESASIHVYVSQGDKMAATLRRIPQNGVNPNPTHRIYLIHKVFEIFLPQQGKNPVLGYIRHSETPLRNSLMGQNYSPVKHYFELS